MWLLVDGRIQGNLHSVAMSDLFFDQALLPEGWAEHVRIGVGDSGSVMSVAANASPEGARRVPGVAVPGVPNIHSHAFQRALAGLAERGSSEGDTFWSWRRRMYGFLSRLDPPAVERIAAQLFVELLERGFTSVVEFHYLRNAPDGASYVDTAEMARRLLSAARRTGIGITLLPTLYRASDFGGVPTIPRQRRFVATIDDLLTDVESLRADIGSDPGGSHGVGLALHSLRAVSPGDLATAVRSARSLDAELPIHIHVAEQAREVEACLAWSGSRPVAWLLDHAPVDHHWCLVHATHIDDREVVGIARSGCVVGLCPTTEANLGDGIFPLDHYSGADGRWGVGTDAHVGRSPTGELRMLEYGQRLALQRRNVAAGHQDRSTGRALLDQAWSSGAMASGRPVGGIDVGKRADIVVLDTDHPALVARAGDDVLDAWIFSGEEQMVSSTFVGGREVVRDGRHVDRPPVADEYRIACETILRRV